MSDPVTVTVFRYDPQKDAAPHYDEYRIDIEEELSVLVLLHRIQNEMDPGLSFRSFCCGLQMCGSCEMKINHKKKFACLSLAKPGDKIIVEPATYPEGHVKDLVVRR